MTRELRLRIISAIVMAVLVLSVTWAGGVYFRVFAAGMALLIYYEWSTITRLSHSGSTGNAWGWFSVAVIAGNMIFGEPDLDIPLLGGLTLTAIVFLAIARQGFWMAGGIFYAGFSGISIAAIRGYDMAGLMLMLTVFAIVWSTDIAAYFVGRAIGGPKLAPPISPGKTWSGAVGGTVAAVLAGLLVVFLWKGQAGIWPVFVAFILSVMSQTGDLFESWIKRRFKVKDSGNLIPGHGGVMDRVDGLVFACFTVFFIAFVHFAVNGTLPAAGESILPGF